MRSGIFSLLRVILGPSGEPINSLLYLVFQTAFCFRVVSGCFVDGVSSSSLIWPNLAPERGPGGLELAFRRPESAHKVHAKSFGP